MGYKIFGLPYCGSKNSLARDLISLLPSGKRLVDLFGGGGAITHAGALSKKWDKVLYNEINPLTFNAFKNAVNGFYAEKNFGKPPFISKSEFKEKRFNDPYVAICFSFGNDIRTYAYGEPTEEYKKALHDAVVFERYEDAKTKYGLDLSELSKYKTVLERHLVAKSLIAKKLDLQAGKNGKKTLNNFVIEEFNGKPVTNYSRIQHLDSWRRMVKIEKREIKEKVEFSCGSYDEYVYQDGDVVYCDPPYEGTGVDYNCEFDFVKFYDWVYSRPYPVYFSSYEISDKRFFKVWEKKRVSPYGDNRGVFNEILWSNRPEIEGRKNLLKMFKG